MSSQASQGYVGAVDQGTTSSRFLIFDPTGQLVASHQIALEQSYPEAGYHQQCAKNILSSVEECMLEVARQLEAQGIAPSQVRAIGITNQRETTIGWDATTGESLYPAIVWSDARTKSLVHQLIGEHPTKSRDAIRAECGLPLATYFSALKMRWMLDNVPAVQAAASNGTLRFGTVDAWLIYHLTGGIHGNGQFLTDVTNASRTMLMDIRTLKWSEPLCDFFKVPMSSLPTIRSSSEIYGTIAEGPFAGVPLAGCLGDQQAALVGQQCFKKGEAKNTYGTGCFMLFNTGEELVVSSHGLLTTIGYQLGPNATPVYALEGSISVAGSALQWLQKNLGIIDSPKDIDEVAGAVPDTGDVYFVPAFNGLFAPYWRDDSRGCIVGLTLYSNKHHIARATLEATCFQTRAILECMRLDSGVQLSKLRVDGGLTNSDLCMQIQADTLGIPVERTAMREATSLGAAIVAGLAVGYWENIEALQQLQIAGYDTFSSTVDPEERERRYSRWQQAIQRSTDWVTTKE